MEPNNFIGFSVNDEGYLCELITSTFTLNGKDLLQIHEVTFYDDWTDELSNTI